ncbi:MAG: molybdenum cofactor biosynthesis protein MoaE [Anaerolineae bacterium]
MQISIKLFARMRELAGAGSLKRELAEPATVADVITLLENEFPAWAQAAPRTVVALNQEFVDPATRLSDGDEVAFFPPVSGGSGAENGKFAITFDPIGPDDMAAKVVTPATGAVAVFGGVVRNVSGGKDVESLEYEAYEAMALAKLRQVADEARRQWPKIVDIAIVQRIGHLEVGETAVVVAVSSPHRNDGCFEACAYAINRLKEIVPIWKKEMGPDGSEWIEGDYLPNASDAA